MRVHVALTPADASGLALEGWAALVVDVLRATTSVVAACAAGCAGVIPVADVDAARARAHDFPDGQVLLAGERGGEPIDGFHLGNSPLEFTRERVAGRTVVLTTTNGTAAMLNAGAAAVGAVAALTNVTAAAAWASVHGRDLAILCSGDDGSFSLEDTVCAGLLVSHMVAASDITLSDAAEAALGIGRYYADRLADLRLASRWARRLARLGRSDDVAACLQRDMSLMVPVIGRGVIVPSGGGGRSPALGAPPSERSVGEPAASASGEPER